MVVTCLSISGCTDKPVGDAAQPVFKVKGKITMAGGPVPNAFVSFSPKGKQPVATGRTGKDGNYTLTTYDTGDGAAAGDYVVLVTKPSASTAPAIPALGSHDAKARTAPDGAAMHAAKAEGSGTGEAESPLPEKYSKANESDLLATVKPSNDNELNFELKP
jgi:hypothetical protein